MKDVIVFFDTEADLVSQETDNEKCITRLLAELRKRKINACFNVAGKLAELYPKTIKSIYEDGHEIGSHMYNHENVLEMNKGELSETLSKTEKLIKELTGERIIGFRAPWLYHNQEVYDVVKERGYKWVSNKRIRRRQIAEHPSLQFSNTGFMSSFNKSLLKGFLSAQWLFFPKKPYYKNGLLEIPLLSSMDGELFGLVDPNQNSSEKQMDFTVNSLKEQYSESQEHFNLTFHDWLMGSGNRMAVFTEMLDFLIEKKSNFILPRELLK